MNINTNLFSYITRLKFYIYCVSLKNYVINSWKMTIIIKLPAANFFIVRSIFIPNYYGCFILYIFLIEKVYA